MSTAELLAAAVALPSVAAGDQPSAGDPTEAGVQPMAMRSMSMSAFTAQEAAVEDPTPPGLPIPTLPDYPTVPGATATQVAAVVVIFLANALQGAISGGFPLPVALPLYLMLVAAYQRLEQLALNHVPTATYAQSGQLLGVVTGKITADDVDGDPLTYTVATLPTKGTVVVLPDGSYTYVASNVLGRDGGTDTFSVTVDDSLGILSHPYAPNGHTTTIDVAVNVAGSGINLGPTILSAISTEVNTGTGIVKGKVLTTDPEGDPVTVSGTSLSGAVTVDGAGNFTFTPTAAARHAAALAIAPINTASLSFTATDSLAASTVLPTLLTVSVVPFNTAPAATVNIGSPGLLGVVSGSVTSVDADGDVTTLTPLVSTTSKGGAVVVTGLGFTYTPTAAARHEAASTTAAPGAGTDTFTLTLSDLYGGSTQVPVTVTISPANTAPTGIASLGLPDQIGVIRGSVLGLDVVDLDPLTYTAQTAYSTLGGIVKVASDGSFTYIPSVPGDTVLLVTTPKADSFKVNIDDGHGGITPVTVNVGANLGITATNGAANPANGAVTGTLNIPGPDVGLLTFTSGTAPTKGTVSYTSTGYTYVPTAAARHAAAQVGAPASALSDTFSIVGTDAGGHSITAATVSVTISPSNVAPTGTATVGSPGALGVVTGKVTATDADLDVLTYTGSSAKGGTVTVDANGNYSYTPTATARHAAATVGAGPSLTQDTITVNVDDGHGAVTPVTATATISPTNIAPTVSYGKVKLAVTATYTATYGDGDSDAPTYTITTAPTKGTLVSTGLGVFAYASTSLGAADSFVITVSDGHGGTIATPLTF